MHTAEPWSGYGPMIEGGAGMAHRSVTRVVVTGETWSDEERANRDRIVACVNGCAGIADPSGVPDLVKALAYFVENADEMREAIARYSDGETETVDALDSLYNAFGGIDLDGITAALARVRGEG